MRIAVIAYVLAWVNHRDCRQGLRRECRCLASCRIQAGRKQSTGYAKGGYSNGVV